MLILALKPGHDGAVAAIEDGRLLFSIEAEKDSHDRYAPLSVDTFLTAARLLDRSPDVVAYGGWHKHGPLGHRTFGAGYFGSDRVGSPLTPFFGSKAHYFTSSHERSHIAMAAGMGQAIAPGETIAVLVWEGEVGTFYVVDSAWQVVRTIPVLDQPGARYAFLFALADVRVPDRGAMPPANDAGKLMALAAFGDPRRARREVVSVVDRIMAAGEMYPLPKHEFAGTLLYNCGTDSADLHDAAALLTQRIFERFASVARRELPSGMRLAISGGCGLNCDWNEMWRRDGHFGSVFVPPCTNDSGSAIGTALDAMAYYADPCPLDWSVYAGLEFDRDVEPSPGSWRRRPARDADVAGALEAGAVLAWVQGRSEIGPRALGNRSLIAAPFSSSTRDRLNAIKRREGYRPIAPCARAEDLARHFDSEVEDPYMLFFRGVRDARLGAVTHVDGSARVQTVTATSNSRLHSLLTVFSDATGVGVLCNTSLNFLGKGFINRTSDLVRYCEDQDVDGFVIGDDWYTREPR